MENDAQRPPADPSAPASPAYSSDPALPQQAAPYSTPTTPGASQAAVPAAWQQPAAMPQYLQQPFPPGSLPPAAVPRPVPPAGGRRHRLALPLTIVFLAIVVAAVVYAYGFHKSATGTNPGGKASGSQQGASAATAAAVVFQKPRGDTTVTTSLAGLDGSVHSAFTADAKALTYAPAYTQSTLGLVEGGSALLTNKAWSHFSLLRPDGTHPQTAGALDGLLAATQQDTPQLTVTSLLTLSDGKALAVEANTATGAVQLVRLDVVKGTTATLLSAVPDRANSAVSYAPLTLVTVSDRAAKAYLWASAAKLDTTDVPGVALITLNLANGSYTAVTLPANVTASRAAVSKDGSLVAYTTVDVGSTPYSTARTHILNIATGKETVVPTEGLLPALGSQGLRFSPDGKYLAEIGSYAADTHQQGMALQILSLKRGDVVHQLDKQGAAYEGEGIIGLGWADDDTVVYTTNHADNGTFAPDSERTHRYDAATDTTFDFPADLGTAIAVLRRP